MTEDDLYRILGRNGRQDPACFMTSTVTPAETAATPYVQKWSPIEAPSSSVTFYVLARDGEQAMRLGIMRLRAMGEDPEACAVVQEPMAWSANLIAGILEVESFEERELRRATHQERSETEQPKETQ